MKMTHGASFCAFWKSERIREAPEAMAAMAEADWRRGGCEGRRCEGKGGAEGGGARTAADVDLHEVGARAGKEGDACLGREHAREQSLARTRRAGEQDARGQAHARRDVPAGGRADERSAAVERRRRQTSHTRTTHTHRRGIATASTAALRLQQLRLRQPRLRRLQ